MMDAKLLRAVSAAAGRLDRLEARGPATYLTLTGLTTPLVVGGTLAASTLTLESTSGVGTTDAIIVKTGSQAEAARFTTDGLFGIGITPIVRLHVKSTLTAALIQRDSTSTTVTNAITTLGLVNEDTTTNNNAQLSFNSLDSAAALRTAALIKGVFTARTSGTITGALTLHANNGTASTMTLIATINPAGLAVVGMIAGAATATSSTVLRLSSVATSDDPTEDFTQGRVATTTATQTTIQTIATTTDTVLTVEAVVVARQTATAGAGTVGNGAAYMVCGTYRNVAGTVTLIGAVTAVYTAEDEAGHDATLTISGTNVLLRVTGAANETITWHSHTRTRRVGS